MKANQVVHDGEVSTLWRALQVETLDFEGRWLRRTDYWPLGITVKPNVDPKDIRSQIATALAFEPAEVRLWDPFA